MAARLLPVQLQPSLPPPPPPPALVSGLCACTSWCFLTYHSFGVVLGTGLNSFGGMLASWVKPCSTAWELSLGSIHRWQGNHMEACTPIVPLDLPFQVYSQQVRWGRVSSAKRQVAHFLYPFPKAVSYFTPTETAFRWECWNFPYCSILFQWCHNPEWRFFWSHTPTGKGNSNQTAVVMRVGIAYWLKQWPPPPWHLPVWCNDETVNWLIDCILHYKLPKLQKIALSHIHRLITLWKYFMSILKCFLLDHIAMKRFSVH